MSESPPRRSEFVTIVAWIAIFLAGGTLLMGLANSAAMWAVFASPEGKEFDRLLDPQELAEAEVPGWLIPLFTHIEWLPLLGVLPNAAVLAVCIGLLRRKEWARRIFNGLLWLQAVLGVGYMLFSTIFVVSSALKAKGEIGPGLGFVIPFVGFFWLLVLAAAGLGLWVSWKITRPEIKAEFRATMAA